MSLKKVPRRGTSSSSAGGLVQGCHIHPKKFPGSNLVEEHGTNDGSHGDVMDKFHDVTSTLMHGDTLSSLSSSTEQERWGLLRKKRRRTTTTSCQ
mmetsp:Transcript_30499/g.50676  ORF Transcript_30499/g.50676 Transcript_30499/m.50676 type:complete len:95 (-) Transcript_30499:153-437(-)